MDVPTLERRLAAARKTIAVLSARVEERLARGDSAFALLAQNDALDRVVREKTAQLEAQRAALQQALAELHMAQAELLQAQKLESVGRLASGIAHEINTPVQFVGDSLQFVRRSLPGVLGLLDRHRALRAAAAAGPVPPALLAELEAAEAELDLDYLKENLPAALDQSAEGLDRVATLVRSMKEFAHPEQRTKVLADVNRALETTLTVARNEYKYLADVETSLGPLPPVPCLVGELNQVFLNLIVNAAHAIEAATAGTGRRGTIRISTWAEEGAVAIAVADTGTGIPEAIRHRIFEPFFTTKAVGKGTGQGLAIARAVVVEKHGGRLSFETAPGQGTTFLIRLPVVAPGGEAEGEPPATGG